MTKIRPMKSDDLDLAAGIINATELFPSDLLADMAAGYLTGAAPDQWFVAEQNAQVIGVAYCEPERMTDGTWNMLAVAVHPDAQGTGAGYALIDHARRTLAGNGARLLLIETADIDDFADQRAFYSRAGLTQAAHIPDYYEPGVGKVTFTQTL